MLNSTLSFRHYFFLDVQYVEKFGLMFSMYCISKIRRNAFSVKDVCDRIKGQKAPLNYLRASAEQRIFFCWCTWPN